MQHIFGTMTIHAFGMVLMLSLLIPGLNAELQNPPTAAATSPNTMPSFILNPPGAADLRRLFERLGATYIKLGQFIASAPTLFPAEYVKEFQSCLDKTPAVPFNEIKAIIRQELGRPLEEVYDFIDPQPLASASVAQVHAARLRGSQKEVVIKVLKPGVEDILTADLSFLYVTARILEFLNPQLSRTSLVGIVGDIRASMLEEVDFRKEALNIDSFRNYVEVMGLAKQATAPFVYRHCSTQRVLTMERLYGVPLTDLNSIRSIVPSPEATLITALNVWFGSLIACETFHADVHAGNLLVLNDGRVGFIDFGIVGRISPLTWAAMETFLASVGNGQYTAMATALVQMGATDSAVDITSFSRDLEKIFSAVQDLDTDVLITTTAGGPGSATVAATMAIDEQQINALLLDVIRVSEAYGLKFPREFGLLLKQLLYFDRYTRLLAPNLNVLEDDRISLRNRGSWPDPFGPRQPRF
jgi:aarF domain-containing kinase